MHVSIRRAQREDSDALTHLAHAAKRYWGYPNELLNLWHKDLTALYNSQMIQYQNCASPVIENGLLYLNLSSPTQSLAALRTSDGEPVWRSQDDGLTYSAPVLTTRSRSSWWVATNATPATSSPPVPVVWYFTALASAR